MDKLHFCPHEHGAMEPVWRDGYEDAELVAWICRDNDCQYWEWPRDDEKGTRRCDLGEA